MSEEELLITKGAGDEVALHNNVADVGLSSTELIWLIHGEDLVKVGIAGDALKLVNKAHVASAG